MNILLIDDDEDDRVFFLETVRDIDAAIECTTIHNAEVALSKLRSISYRSPDVIFLDLNMPKMNGIECLKELKGDNALLTIPVIIYSTSSFDWDIRKALRLGAKDFVIKPTSGRELENAIKFVLRSLDL